MSIRFEGVMPAVTTPFDDALKVDHGFLGKHVRWLIEHGCTGIVPCGSLGESATLSFEEKIDVFKTCVRAAGQTPVVPGIAALSTDEAARLAQAAADAGCRGLMVLPPYVYLGDAREIRAHFDTVLGATRLSCMLYNNPIAYGTDVLPEQVLQYAERHNNLRAVKESSGDVRRITAIKALAGERLAVFVGLDDLIVEGMAAGAVGWVAGLVNALPAESVRLFQLAREGEHTQAQELYEWFLPLLRLDTVPKFVQLIKMVQHVVRMGDERVRPPRLTLEGEEREHALEVIHHAISTRPEL
jgi:4-hydroxy-tetrahydrodipicolinate synthase